MKKTFKFMVVAAVLAFAANSSLMAQFKFGVKASGTLNNIYTEDSTTTSMKPGFNVGIMGEYFLNDNMSVGAELLFAQQGCQEKDEGEDLGVKWSSKTAITTNHINLPIMFRYYFGGLAVELGPQFGFWFSCTPTFAITRRRLLVNLSISFSCEVGVNKASALPRK